MISGPVKVRRLMSKTMCAGCALLFCASPPVLRAQTVLGVVTERGNSAPVEGALVLILDDQGRTRDGVLTNAEGRFRFNLATDSVWTLQVERIGFETVRLAPVTFDGSGVARLEVVLTPAPLEIDGFTVEGTRRCTVRPAEGLLVAHLWEEARKVLRNTRWHEMTGQIRFGVVRFEREIDVVEGLTLGETRDPLEWVDGNPIQAVGAEDLVANGFIRPDGTGFRYYGPDAHVLLSDLFLDTHCFRLASRPPEAGLIGLSFEPARPTQHADVIGTLWLDATDARPRWLDFRYTFDPWLEAKGFAAGRVDFEELPGGAWIVRRWKIRMPVMERNLALMGRGQGGLRVAAIAEVGGQVVQTQFPNQPRPADRPTGMVIGTVWDSTTSRPLAGAEVYVSGTSLVGTSLPDGTFRIALVPEGSHDLAFFHPRLDSLGVYPASVPVQLMAGSVAEAGLAIPAISTVLRALCGETAGTHGGSVLTGVVRSKTGGPPVAGAEVRVEWSDYKVLSGADIRADVEGIEVAGNDRGRFRVCGIPPGVLLAAQASVAGHQGPTRRTTVGRQQVQTLDLSLSLEDDEPDTPLPRCAAGPGHEQRTELTGRVLDGATGVSIGGTTVWATPADSGDAVPVQGDAAGRFLFCGLPVGRYTLRTTVRGIGEAREEVMVLATGVHEVDLPIRASAKGPGTGSIRGRVIGEDGAPVSDAEIRFSAGKPLLTGPDGEFIAQGVPVGPISIDVSHLGLGRAAGEVVVAAGQTVTVEMRLSSHPIELEPLVVVAVRYSSGGMLAEVRRRAESAWGTVLMGETLESRQRTATRTTDMLRDTGLEVYENGRVVFFRRTQCAPHVYLDGVRITRVPRSGPIPGFDHPIEEAADALNMVDPATLAAIEVYRGPAEIPGEFLDSDARCGVILLWTRRGGQADANRPQILLTSLFFQRPMPGRVWGTPMRLVLTPRLTVQDARPADSLLTREELDPLCRFGGIAPESHEVLRDLFSAEGQQWYSIKATGHQPYPGRRRSP